MGVEDKEGALDRMIADGEITEDQRGDVLVHPMGDCCTHLGHEAGRQRKACWPAQCAPGEVEKVEG